MSQTHKAAGKLLAVSAVLLSNKPKKTNEPTDPFTADTGFRFDRVIYHHLNLQSSKISTKLEIAEAYVLLGRHRPYLVSLLP